MAGGMGENCFPIMAAVKMLLKKQKKKKSADAARTRRLFKDVVHHEENIATEQNQTNFSLFFCRVVMLKQASLLRLRLWTSPG